ncbi:hypothetical protein [Phenylobacterium sp.]|uniref:hypothetical protein n=1 Tax=Phenylobacterium sp. TaxID=1871053 RepID=UPI002FCC2D61
MTRLAALILVLAVTSTGSAASAQTCLSVLGCAAKSTGTSAVTPPNLAVGPTPGTLEAAAGPTLSEGGAALLYDSLGNLRAIPGAARSDPNPVTPSAPDLVTKSPSISPNGAPAASDPRAARLQAIPQGPD